MAEFVKPIDLNGLMLGVVKEPTPIIKVEVVETVTTSVEEQNKNMELLNVCYNDWNSLDKQRKEYLRFMRYLNGDQWGDLIEDPDHPQHYITERAYFSRTGITPITQNVLQQYIRNVLGQMLSNKYKSVVNARREEDSEVAEMITNALQTVLEANENNTIDINNIIALHTIGISWNKLTFTKWDERNTTDVRLDHINPIRIAWNRDTEDPRLLDLRRICELHSYTHDEIIASFATTEAEQARIETILNEYSVANRERWENQNNEALDTLENMDFWGSANEINKYRVIEVWTKRSRWVLWSNDRARFEPPQETTELIDQIEVAIAIENAKRIALGAQKGIPPEQIPIIETEKHFEQYWYVQFLLPNGVCLLEKETPFNHGSHPYVFASMPLINGQSKPLFSDLIEMQRNINRQRTMLDMLIASSAKNTLFIPEDALEGHSIEEYADQLMKINGVIKYKPKAGVNVLPEFLQRNSINLGVFDVLNFDMNQIQSISGLSGAIQGQVASPNTPASLYAQQAQNTMINFVLLGDRFSTYCLRRDSKIIKLITQYYTAPRYINISGQSYGKAIAEYDPQKAQAIADSYSLVPSQGVDTPIFRERINEYLMDMLKGGLIPIEVFLQHTTLPFGKQLLAELNTLKQQSQQGQIDPNTVGAIQQMAQQGQAQAGRTPEQTQQANEMIAKMMQAPKQPQE